ncbi:MAG: protein kinase, partial [Planctomycetota bacterium]|nr:protein kinase [Planctomycetota bacterium]
MKACDGIAYAHSKGVVHRDLKPDNVMVGEYGEVLVMDWGLAKVRSGRVGSEPASQPETESRRAGEEAREADTIAEGTASRESDTATPQQSDSSTAPSSQPSAAVSSVRSDVQEALTMEGAVHGTPQYMPPEQAEGKLDEIDQRSDIYSLGAILYEMLTLKRPISGKTPQEILLKVVEHRIDPPEKSAPNRNIPRELSAIAMKAMAGHRRNRYQSVSELQDDINLYMSGRAVSAKEDTAFEAICKLIKRNKGIAATAAVVIIAVAVVLSVAYKNVGTQISIAQSALADTQANESKARASTGKQREDAKAAAKRFSMQAARAAEANRFIETERRLSDAESVFSDSPYIFYARGKYSEVR